MWGARSIVGELFGKRTRRRRGGGGGCYSASLPPPAKCDFGAAHHRCVHVREESCGAGEFWVFSYDRQQKHVPDMKKEGCLSDDS